MRLRLDLTRNQQNAAATIAPLNVAKACDRGEPPVDNLPSRHLTGGGLPGVNVCGRRIFDGKRTCRFSWCPNVICNGKTDIILVASGRGKSD